MADETIKPIEATVKDSTVQTASSFWKDVWEDIHINASGLAMFTFGAAAIIHPEWKDQCNQLAELSATYLFASAKRAK